MKNQLKLVTLIALALPLVAFAAENEGENYGNSHGGDNGSHGENYGNSGDGNNHGGGYSGGGHGGHGSPTPPPHVAPPVTIYQNPTTNSGNINNTATATSKAMATSNANASATGGSVNVGAGALSPSATVYVSPGAVQGGKGGSVEIEKGAIQNSNNVQGGKSIIEEGAVQNSNNISAQGGKGGEGGNVKNSGNIEKGAVQVNVDARTIQAKQPRAIATTPNALPVTYGSAPTSFYPIGEPNSVGSAGFVSVYENHCQTQMSGDNVIRFKTDHENGIATLDDQARMAGAKTAPQVRVVKGPQQIATTGGRCTCLGTLQVEASIDPEMAREGNMATINAAAGKWVRANLRGPKLVQLVYSPSSVTFQKGTMGHAGSAGIGGAISAVLGSTIAMASPSFGRTNAYSTDYPIVGITYILIGGSEEDDVNDVRTLDIAEFMNEVENMPRSEHWTIPSALPVSQTPNQATK